MTKLSFERRLEKTLFEAKELSGLWTNTTISNILDVQISAVESGIEQGDAEAVINDYIPMLEETMEYADKELQLQER